MDADDVAYPPRLESSSSCRVEADVIGCGVRIVNGGEGYALYAAWLNGLTSHAAIMRERFIESPLAHPTVMMRTALLRALGGYRDLPWPEDYDLWLRAAAHGARFGKASAVLLDWTDYPERTSRRDPRYSPEAFLQCKAHFLRPVVGERCTIRSGPVGSRLHSACERYNGQSFCRHRRAQNRQCPRWQSDRFSRRDHPLTDAPVLSAVATTAGRAIVRQPSSPKGLSRGRHSGVV